jgi:hypothetical protein
MQFALTFRCPDSVPTSDKAKTEIEFDGWFCIHTNPIKHDANKPHWNRISLFEPEITKQLWDVIWDSPLSETDTFKKYSGRINKPSRTTSVSEFEVITRPFLQFVKFENPDKVHFLRGDMRRLSLKMLEYIHLVDCDDKVRACKSQVKHDSADTTLSYRSSTIDDLSLFPTQLMRIKIENGDIVLCGIEEAEIPTKKRKEVDTEEIEAILNKKRGRGGTLQMKAELKSLLDS